MSRTEGEAPRQSAEQFAANDAVAQQQGGAAQTAPVQTCPPLWTLKVNVRARTSARRPRLEAARAELSWSDRTLDSRDCGFVADDHRAALPLRGRGATEVTCTAVSRGWYTENKPKLSLADGDDKTVDLELKPAPWVAFKVVDERGDVPVDAVRVEANFPDLGDQQGTTADGKPLEIEHDALRPGQTCTLLALAHAAFAWEVVGDIATE